MKRYSVFALAREALSYHMGWERAWRSPTPKAAYDAIIVGAHKQTWLGKLLGGSLAESVLRAARCAVMAVPPATRR